MTAAEDAPARLRWGVKASFLNYIRRSGPSVITGLADESHVVLTRSMGKPGRWAYEGGIDITAHGGLLHIRLLQPHLELYDDGSATLSFALDDSGTRRADVLVLGPSDPGQWAAYLTEDGAAVFDDVYPPGTRMDDVTSLDV